MKEERRQLIKHSFLQEAVISDRLIRKCKQQQMRVVDVE